MKKMLMRNVAAVGGALLALATFAPSAHAVLMTYDLRAPDGSKTVTLAGNGSTVVLDLFAVITNGNANLNDDGYQQGAGTFKSSTGGPKLGNLSTQANISGFNFTGSTTGLQQDVDGDGDLDVGSTDTSAATNYFTAIASTTPNATFPEPANGFLIGHVLFTVTDALAGSTTIDFVPRIKSTGTGQTLHRGTSDNAPFTIAGNDANLAVGAGVLIQVPEPGTIGMVGLSLLGLAARRRRTV